MPCISTGKRSGPRRKEEIANSVQGDAVPNGWITSRIQTIWNGPDYNGCDGFGPIKGQRHLPNGIKVEKMESPQGPIDVLIGKDHMCEALREHEDKGRVVL
jgi:hypothetical protein